MNYLKGQQRGVEAAAVLLQQLLGYNNNWSTNIEGKKKSIMFAIWYRIVSFYTSINCSSIHVNAAFDALSLSKKVLNVVNWCFVGANLPPWISSDGADSDRSYQMERNIEIPCVAVKAATSAPTCRIAQTAAGQLSFQLSDSSRNG